MAEQNVPVTADSLREFADWLDEHPDITVWYAWAHLNPVYEVTREDLERIAEAFGPEAVETARDSQVEIARMFGNVKALVTAPVSALADEPQPPKYDPILTSVGGAS